MRRTSLASLIVAGAAFAQGWVGQGIVSRPDSSTDQHAVISMDRFGTPMVVWHGEGPGYSMAFSRWTGAGWSPEQGVGRDTSGDFERFPFSLSMDDSGRLWLLSSNQWAHPDDSIYTASYVWLDTAWNPEVAVTTRDLGECGGGRIGCGGGQVWCVWDNWRDGYPFAVYASHWGGTDRAWGPPMRVSPANGNRHWFGEIAVDRRGTPHVVWNELEGYRILYSTYDGMRWSDPVRVDDSTLGMASWMAGPRMSIDSSDNLHVTYTGAWTGALHRNVFYTRFDGQTWSKQVCPNRDTIHNVDYSDVAVDRAGNVWCAWDRTTGASDGSGVYAASFDGMRWSDDTRLDDGSSWDDHWPRVALDSVGDPWVVWMASSDSPVLQTRIFYNRYSSAVSLAERSTGARTPGARIQVISAVGGLRIGFDLCEPGPAVISIFDQPGRRVRRIDQGRLPAGHHSAVWDGRSDSGARVARGVYFCRLTAGAGLSETTCKFLLRNR